MKLKVKSSRRGVKLKGETAGTEELLYAEAECVKTGCIEALFPFRYERRKKGYAFEYSVGCARLLKEFLRAPLSQEHFESMLTSFVELAKECDARSLTLQRVCFEEACLFFDPARYSLRFAYLPVRGATGRLAGPLDALEHLARHAWLEGAQAQQLACNALDYVRRSVIFSWPDYESFLHEQGVRSLAGIRPVDAPDRSASGRSTSKFLHGYDFTCL